MKVKLTLSMDKDVIARAKRLAASRSESLSKMIEELLSERVDNEQQQFRSRITKLASMFSETKTDKDVDWKREIRNTVNEKFSK